MTTSEIDKLESGVELDRLVAEAIGMETSTAILMPLSTSKFKPSTDWNDAMEAAEKVRLFYPDSFLDFDYACRWRVQELDTCTPEVQVITEHKSGPVAICRAILKAKNP